MKSKSKELSDGSIFYSFDDIKAILNEKNNEIPKIFVRDIIIAILAVKPNYPIFGRTMFTKQIFLIYEEILKSQENISFQDPKFVAYNYGPYSFFVMQILEDLRYSNYISIEGKKGTRSEKISLKLNTKTDIYQLINHIPDDILENLKNRRVGWDQLGTDGILRYVYENYPDMKENSKIKEKYKDILWGQV